MATNTKNTARKSATAPKAAKKVAPKAAPVAAEGEKDWTYLVEKDPTNLHTTFAAWISAELGVEMPAEHVQYVLGMHHAFQKGEKNKARADYKPLAAPIVAKRSEHMKAAHVEAREIMTGAEAAKQAKKAAAAAKRKATLAAKKAAAEKA